MPGQTFTATATTPAAPEEIWASFQLPVTWESISGVDAVFDPVFADGDLVGFSFHSTAAGRRYLGKATPGPREVDSSLTWNIATSEVRGWVRVDLIPAGAQTRIDVTMRVDSVSMMASIAFPLIAGAIAGGFQETANRFAAAISEG